MNVEEGVRATVRDLAAGAPAPVGLADAARRQGRKIRRRRRAGVAAVALALVAVAVTPYAIVKKQEERPAPVSPTPRPSADEVRRTAVPRDWANKPVMLPGDAVMTALTRTNVGSQKPVGRTVQTGNVVLDRKTGRYVALQGDYYTVWGAPKTNRAVVSDDGGGLGLVRADGSVKWLRIDYTLEPQWSPDGKRVLVTTSQGYALIDGATGKVSRHALPDVIALCPDECLFTWLADGRQVAIAQRDPAVPQSESKADTIKNIAIFSAFSGRPIGIMDAPGVPVSGSPWSPNGDLVLLRPAELDGTGVRIFNVNGHGLIATLPGTDARFLPGGAILVLTDKTASLYDPWGRLREEMTLPPDFSFRTVSAGVR
jgi:hypothetical protein